MSEYQPRPQGFDAPVEDAANDYLNRWPLAQQIYNVAANGPLEWAVRIGVYGEWGTGKTSVLKFVSSMAEQDGHIVVWFDPWAFTDETEMWRAYVTSIHDALEARLGPIEEVKNLAKGKWLTRTSAIPKIFGIVNKQAGELTDMGLAWLKKYFDHHTEALKQLRHVLRTTRVFVIIDDLDRTAAELVPDILYALKEVMDIKGFSFICGFDPTIVGSVLGARHPGFGDGLKFLEKIIDYPIWLTPAKSDGLAKIALADAKRYCPFVPVEDLKEILPDIPQSPRAIRQFIRLLSLLNAQTGRHHDYELRWSIILASCVIKIRHPKVAEELLGDRSFWSDLRILNFSKELSGKRKESEALIEKHIDDKIKSLGPDLEEEKGHLTKILLRIGNHLSAFGGKSVDYICSQISIVEQPQAVTWKEFDAFLSSPNSATRLESLKAWISNHARQQHHRETDVASEFCMAAVDRFCSEIQKADMGFDLSSSSQHEAAASEMLELLKVIVLELGKTLESLSDGAWLPIKDLFPKLAQFARANTSKQKQMWPSIEEFLLRVAGDSAMDLKVIAEAAQKAGFAPQNGSNEGSFAQKLKASLNKHKCNLVISGLTRQGFAYRALYDTEENLRIVSVFQAFRMPFNASFRVQVLDIFQTQSDNANVRENAYHLMDWLDDALSGRRPQDKPEADKFLEDKEMVIAIWNAVTGAAINERHAYGFKNLPDLLREHGIDVSIPLWWRSSIKEYENFLQADAVQPTEAPAIATENET